jgi:hypothetical protein
MSHQALDLLLEINSKTHLKIPKLIAGTHPDKDNKKKHPKLLQEA